MPESSAPERTGLILAGGKGERMGGAYKPLVAYRGRPLISWALDALAPLCDELVVAYGPAPLRADLVAVVGERARFVPDEGAGPVSGLRAGAQAARGAWLLVAPVDSPNLAAPLYQELLAAVGAREGACALADGHVNALVGVYRRAPLLAALWTGIAHSPREAIARMDVVTVPVSAEDVRDVDSPGDLRA